MKVLLGEDDFFRSIKNWGGIVVILYQNKACREYFETRDRRKPVGRGNQAQNVFLCCTVVARGDNGWWCAKVCANPSLFY